MKLTQEDKETIEHALRMWIMNINQKANDFKGISFDKEIIHAETLRQKFYNEAYITSAETASKTRIKIIKNCID